MTKVRVVCAKLEAEVCLFVHFFASNASTDTHTYRADAVVLVREDEWANLKGDPLRQRDYVACRMRYALEAAADAKKAAAREALIEAATTAAVSVEVAGADDTQQRAAAQESIVEGVAADIQRAADTQKVVQEATGVKAAAVHSLSSEVLADAATAASAESSSHSSDPQSQQADTPAAASDRWKGWTGDSQPYSLIPRPTRPPSIHTDTPPLAAGTHTNTPSLTSNASPSHPTKHNQSIPKLPSVTLLPPKPRLAPVISGYTRMSIGYSIQWRDGRKSRGGSSNGKSDNSESRQKGGMSEKSK